MTETCWCFEINFPKDRNGQPQRERWSRSRFFTRSEEVAAVLAGEYEKNAQANGVEVDTRLREIPIPTGCVLI